MSTPKDLKVVRIPCDSTIPIELTSVPLIAVDHDDISVDECLAIAIDKKLKHIPNMKSLDEPKTFSWDHRGLYVGQPFKSAVSRFWDAEYMVYVSVDSKAGLAANVHIQRLAEDLYRNHRWTGTMDEVYGDAFVFRMKSAADEVDAPERAEYVDMDEEFISSLKGVDLATKVMVGDHATEIMGLLLVHSRRVPILE